MIGFMAVNDYGNDNGFGWLLIATMVTMVTMKSSVYGTISLWQFLWL